MSTTGAYTFKHDGEYEDLSKLPRRGMWNRHSGRINIRCPDCGNVATVDGHKRIGNVLSPSVVCPHSGCGFHAVPVTLDGFVPAPGDLK